MAPCRDRLLAAAFGALLALSLALAAAPLAARATTADIVAAALPAEARATLAQIHRGGPFRYDRDGIVFGNREHLLPSKPRGHYREYTVPTPGVSTRGARRIICGGPPKAPEACWYTADHYQSFRRIVE
jgi:ribonuclease T1